MLISLKVFDVQNVLCFEGNNLIIFYSIFVFCMG